MDKAAHLLDAFGSVHGQRFVPGPAYRTGEPSGRNLLSARTGVYWGVPVAGPMRTVTTSGERRPGTLTNSVIRDNSRWHCRHNGNQLRRPHPHNPGRGKDWGDASVLSGVPWIIAVERNVLRGAEPPAKICGSGRNDFLLDNRVAPRLD